MVPILHLQEKTNTISHLILCKKIEKVYKRNILRLFPKNFKHEKQLIAFYH